MNRPGRFWPQTAAGCLFWLLAIGAIAALIFVIAR